MATEEKKLKKLLEGVPDRIGSTEDKLLEAFLQREVAISELFKLLASGQCDVNEANNKLDSYISTYGRLLYSAVSSVIFLLEDEELENVTLNVERLLKETLQQYENSDDKDDQKVYTMTKLYDHTILAINQLRFLKQSDEEFAAKFTEEINPSINKITGKFKQQFDTFQKSMITQLISLVGIFTAMAFLVFGGINALDNIFNGAANFPISKVCIIGSIWGIAVLNLIVIFMLFISKLTGKTLKPRYNDILDVKTTIELANVFLFFSLAVSGWVYLIDYLDAGKLVWWISGNHPFVFLISGSILILIVFIIITFIIIKKNLTINARG